MLEAHQGFHTTLLRKRQISEAAEIPPPETAQLVAYPAPLGSNAAYITPAPHDGKKHPAIIWLVGGFSNSISPISWEHGPRANDQSAFEFRTHGIVTMYPSLRGGNDNRGYIETFYGEVEDVLAAAKYLAKLEYVDPTRIYLGGHSTGGTLALLVAAASRDQFRAVFSLGPVDDAVGYGSDVLPFDTHNAKEAELREPLHWLPDISCPTCVFEGTKSPSNISSLRLMQRSSKNPLVKFFSVPNETHFSVIAPLVSEISGAILADRPAAEKFRFRETIEASPANSTVK